MFLNGRLRIARADDVAEGQAVKFTFTREGISREGLLARFRGRLVAYQNVCRHIPLSLDDGDERFFAEDGSHFVCHNHGALFDPASGLCVEGPCEGARLFQLPVEVEDGEVWLASEGSE